MAAAGHVVVTPLTSRESIPVAVCPHALVNKVLIKAFVKGCKKEFTLRNINTHEVTSFDQLQQVIKGQLGDKVSQNNFDVGYLQGANFVTVRNAADLVEVWTKYSEGRKCNLWCDCLKNTKSSQACRSQAVNSDSSDDDGGVEEVSRKRKKKSRNDDFEDNGGKLTTGIRKYKTRLICCLKSMATNHTHRCSTVYSLRCIQGVYIRALIVLPIQPCFIELEVVVQKRKTTHQRLPQLLET